MKVKNKVKIYKLKVKKKLKRLKGYQGAGSTFELSPIPRVA